MGWGGVGVGWGGVGWEWKGGEEEREGWWWLWCGRGVAKACLSMLMHARAADKMD